jgi:hypothetical protein
VHDARPLDEAEILLRSSYRMPAPDLREAFGVR